MKDFQISFNKEYGVIESRIHSSFNSSLLNNMAPELAKMTKETNAKALLLDFSKSKISFSTLEIYKIPEKLYRIFLDHNLDLRLMKRAILISKRNEDFTFLETVSKNSGQNFRLFYDEKEAMKWLINH